MDGNSLGMLLHKVQHINSPIDFDVGLLDSNDHAIALAAQKITNKATGDAVSTDNSRSKCIELIFAIDQFARLSIQ